MSGLLLTTLREYDIPKTVRTSYICEQCNVALSWTMLGKMSYKESFVITVHLISVIYYIYRH